MGLTPEETYSFFPAQLSFSLPYDLQASTNGTPLYLFIWVEKMKRGSKLDLFGGTQQTHTASNFHGGENEMSKPYLKRKMISDKIHFFSKKFRTNRISKIL